MGRRKQKLRSSTEVEGSANSHSHSQLMDSEGWSSANEPPSLFDETEGVSGEATAEDETPPDIDQEITDDDKCENVQRSIESVDSDGCGSNNIKEEGDPTLVELWRLNYAELLLQVRERTPNQQKLQCMRCGQYIEEGDVFFCLPNDKRKRRVWCDRLQLVYEHTLRKWHLWKTKCFCQRHFRGGDLNQYRLKADFEANAEPMTRDEFSQVKGVEQRTSNLLIKFRTPNGYIKKQEWGCTLCPQMCDSPYDLYVHILVKHNMPSAKKLFKSQPAEDRAIACPFCQNCSYRYRNINGFLRHLTQVPTVHVYLMRILKEAELLGQSMHLHPHTEWESWTAVNVSRSILGCSYTTYDNLQLEDVERSSSAKSEPVSAERKEVSNPFSISLPGYKPTGAATTSPSSSSVPRGIARKDLIPSNAAPVRSATVLMGETKPLDMAALFGNASAVEPAPSPHCSIADEPEEDSGQILLPPPKLEPVSEPIKMECVSPAPILEPEIEVNNVKNYSKRTKQKPKKQKVNFTPVKDCRSKKRPSQLNTKNNKSKTKKECSSTPDSLLRRSGRLRRNGESSAKESNNVDRPIPEEDTEKNTGSTLSGLLQADSTVKAETDTTGDNDASVVSAQPPRSPNKLSTLSDLLPLPPDIERQPEPTDRQPRKFVITRKSIGSAFVAQARPMRPSSSSSEYPTLSSFRPTAKSLDSDDLPMRLLSAHHGAYRKYGPFYMQRFLKVNQHRCQICNLAMASEKALDAHTATVHRVTLPKVRGRLVQCDK